MSLKKKKNQDTSTYMMDAVAEHGHNPYWSSSLFNEVYLKKDFPVEYKDQWENTNIGSLYDFINGFENLVKEKEHENFTKWSEPDTITNWIRPVMTLLGWENFKKPNENYAIDNEYFSVDEGGKKKGYKPDLMYFDSPAHKKRLQESSDKLEAARNNKFGPKMVLEAKYWDRLEEYKKGSKPRNKDTINDETTKSLPPEEQTLKYQEFLNLEFGILTDGKTWKLLHKDYSKDSSVQRCFEFDLGNLMFLAKKVDRYNVREEFEENAKYFYFMFSKEAHQKEENKNSIVQNLLHYSTKYAADIEDKLKAKFVKCMGLMCNAFKNISPQADNDLIRSVSESHIFNMLFIKSCEVRRILPTQSPNYKAISLTEVVEVLDQISYDPRMEFSEFEDDIKGKLNPKVSHDTFEVYDRFINLYGTVHKGTSKENNYGFEIQGFKESIFSKEEWDFARKNKICNERMLRILFELNYVESQIKGREYQQVPYSYFTPRQLGSIYESFLDFKLKEALADMIFHENEWKEANLGSRKVLEMNISKEYQVKKGDLYFDSDDIDRKMTGSYYTPDYVVNYIIEASIAPLLEKVKNAKQILELKICDPAMGSGHFLSGVLNYLTKVYREKLSDELMDDLSESFAQSARKVLDSCIFGADLNPRAVKLAKMSLWLSTAETSLKLENLDDQLKNFDSLRANWNKQYPVIFKNGGFDCTVGNPPWGAKLTNDERDSLSEVYPEVSVGCTNTFKFFSSASFNILRKGGIFGFIIPNTFYVQPKYKDLKDFFLTKSVIETVNLGDGIFGPTVTAPCAIVIAVNTPSKSKTLPIKDISMEADKEFALLRNNQKEQKQTKRSSKKTFLFSELVEAKDCGIKHQRNGCGLENKGKSDLAERLYYEGRKQSVKDIKYIIGADLDKTGFFLTTENDRYFKHNFKQILRSNETVYFNKDVMELEEKLLWRQTADRPICAIGDNTYFANTLQAGLLTDKSRSIGLSLKFLCCVLNSTWFRYMYLTKVMEGGRVFPQVKLTYLKDMPICEAEKSDIKAIEALYDKVMKKNSSAFEEIDKKIFELYGCSKEEIKKAVEVTSMSSKDLKKAA